MIHIILIFGLSRNTTAKETETKAKKKCRPKYCIENYRFTMTNPKQVVLIDMMFLIHFEEFTDTHSLTLNYVF